MKSSRQDDICSRQIQREIRFSPSPFASPRSEGSEISGASIRLLMTTRWLRVSRGRRQRASCSRGVSPLAKHSTRVNPLCTVISVRPYVVSTRYCRVAPRKFRRDNVEWRAAVASDSSMCHRLESRRVCNGSACTRVFLAVVHTLRMQRDAMRCSCSRINPAARCNALRGSTICPSIAEAMLGQNRNALAVRATGKLSLASRLRILERIL